MPKFLTMRLARTNLWKNRQTYAPFLLATVMLTFTMYSFADITVNPALRQVPGYTSFLFMLSLGLVVIGLFSAIFLFYANGFLMKRRKKEVGLYSILGMEKKHIVRVLRNELFLCYLLSMVIGLGLGMLLSRLLFLVIRLVLRSEFTFVPSTSPLALIGIPSLFFGLYLLLMFYNSWQVRTVNPIELLKGGQVGEREPKARWFLGIIGAILLIAGYWLAITVRNPVSALTLFFVAVVLVIIGTYCLFLAGTLTVLKLLKNNKRIFYRPQNFVTLSGMLYRMKQNAAGLASIAILCTMAMVTIGTTVALYRGAEDSLNTLYPSDLKLNVSSGDELPRARAAVEYAAQDVGISIRQLKTFESYEDVMIYEDGDLRHWGDQTSGFTAPLQENAVMVEVSMFTESMFDALQGVSISLGDNEMAWYSQDIRLPAGVTSGGRVYATRELTDLNFLPSFTSGTSIGSLYLVVKDEAVARALLPGLGEDSLDAARFAFILQADVEGSSEQKEAFVSAFKARFEDYHALFARERLRSEMYALYGGFLFVGVFIGTLFLMATSLIIYFKQISEGYQDQDRFVILQKVGMSQNEVRKTVSRQILTVFFLPLAVAICHVAGSLHMITLMLRMLRLSNAPYIASNVFLAAAFVALLYGVFYAKTAKTYYKMVRF